jgi:hypothetical protein
VRTTLDIDDELLPIVRQLANQRGTTMGRVVSDLARQALAPKSRERVRNGFRLFTPTPGSRRPDLQLVNELRDEP